MIKCDLGFAGDLIRKGHLVAFPTETVYGLGADATNDKAVAAIYELKGRPSFNPLIAHVDSIEMAEKCVDMTPLAYRLMEAFWPGPLTLILKRKKDSGISYLATAGLETLAIRMPNHPMALQLIHEAGRPIVAPSANPSGKVSPTTAKHVLMSFKERAPYVMDGGPSNVGVESTIVSLVGDVPAVLRYGGLPIEAIEPIAGPLMHVHSNPNAPMSPGQLKSHYAPSIPVRLNVEAPEKGEAYLAFGKTSAKATLNLSPSGDLKEAAANLFAYLRRLDMPKYKSIAVAPIPMEGLGLAINDRLNRASYKS